MKLKLEIETWIWNLKLKLKIVAWNRNLKFKHEIGIWNSSLKFKLEIETWFWIWKLKLEIEIWNSNLELKLEIKTWILRAYSFRLPTLVLEGMPYLSLFESAQFGAPFYLFCACLASCGTKIMIENFFWA